MVVSSCSTTRARDVFVLPEKAAKMFFVVFREDYFLDDACRKVVASKRRSLSLSFERARACANAQKLKGFRGLKNTRKNMCFLYLYLFLTTKTPQRAPLADVRAPTTPGRGGLARDGFESVVVFVRAFRRDSADDGETRDRRRDVVQTWGGRTPGRRKARKEKSETRAARDGVAIARHG